MARYLIDVNLPRRFSLWLQYDCVYVTDIDPSWTDTDIWRHAATETRTIVSKDADFSERVLLSNDGPSVIHVKVGNVRMRDLHVLLFRAWPEATKLAASSRLVTIYRDRIEAIG